MAGDGLCWLVHLRRSFCPHLRCQSPGYRTVARSPISTTAETDLTSGDIAILAYCDCESGVEEGALAASPAAR
jgi:hypothetical protein